MDRHTRRGGGQAFGDRGNFTKDNYRVYMNALAGYGVLAADATSRHWGGVAVF